MTDDDSRRGCDELVVFFDHASIKHTFGLEAKGSGTFAVTWLPFGPCLAEHGH